MGENQYTQLLDTKFGVGFLRALVAIASLPPNLISCIIIIQAPMWILLRPSDIREMSDASIKQDVVSTLLEAPLY